MADAASRAGHVQAAAGAASLSSWRRRPLARPQAAAQLAPHRLYVLARLLTPPKGVWEGPRAIVHLPRNT
eukprot:scaffold8662_cov110-Isochrysis_galbana.AAC.1